MTKSRKPRTDTVGNLHRVISAADRDLPPPVHVPLTERELLYWQNLIAERAKADWSPHERDISAFLARTMARLEFEQRTLSEEGFVVTRPSGIVAPNPRNRIVGQLKGQVLALRRSLGLTGRAKAGSSEQAAQQREANRRAEREYRSGSAGDNLLA